MIRLIRPMNHVSPIHKRNDLVHWPNTFGAKGPPPKYVPYAMTQCQQLVVYSQHQFVFNRYIRSTLEYKVSKRNARHRA